MQLKETKANNARSREETTPVVITTSAPRLLTCAVCGGEICKGDRALERDLGGATVEYLCSEGCLDQAHPYEVYRDYGAKIGALVADKQRQYGDAVGKTGAMLAILYPNGVCPFQYTDVLMTVRVFDKLSRIAQRDADGKDLGGETPWKDIAGYGLLGWRKDEEGKTG